MTEDLPLPEPDGVLVVGTQACRAFTADAMRAYAWKRAQLHHADQMRKLREAQGLSDERIEEIAAELEAARDPMTSFDETAFAHAIADPLLARIAELDAGWQAANVRALEASMERDALRTQLAEAQKALLHLVRNFPTDTDMAEAGWDGTEIQTACDAYDVGRAVLAALTPKEPTP